MSHGGMGGGGHSGFGHHGGDGGVFHSHGGHVVHHGSSVVGHGFSFGGHGNIIGHILHALGLGHHHAHGIHSAHQPDQSPTWNQAMQAEKGWRKLLRQPGIRPAGFILMMAVISLGWLALIYTVHKSENASRKPEASAVAPAYSPYGAPAPIASQPLSQLPAQYAGAPAVSGYATTYGAPPLAQGYSQFQSPAWPANRIYGQARMAPDTALTRYVPEAGGRQRLFVSR